MADYFLSYLLLINFDRARFAGLEAWIYHTQHCQLKYDSAQNKPHHLDGLVRDASSL